MKTVNTKNVSLSTNDKIGFITNLTTMLGAGIPIIETIDSMMEDSKGNVKKLLETIREDLMQGQRLHVSFAKFPRVFDQVTVNIIKASEEGGTLTTALADLRENIKRDAEFTDKIKSALIYPIFILVVFIGVLLMILIVVVPKIATVFKRLRVDLPLPTQILIFLSDLITKNTIPVIIVLALFTTLFVYIFKTRKSLLIKGLISLPLISGVAIDIDITRFCRSLHLLLSAGLPIVTALELSQNIVKKKEVEKMINASKEMVSSGKRLSEGFKLHKKVMPSIIIKIVEAGEKSGSLDKSMQEAADFLDYQVSGRLKTLTALIEPIMLVGVGVMVGGMMLAIIAPIYGLIGSVGAH